jgi:hypothetical protein
MLTSSCGACTGKFLQTCLGTDALDRIMRNFMPACRAARGAGAALSA